MPTPPTPVVAKRRWPILVVGLLLLGAAAYFMAQGEPPEHTPAVEKVAFPRYMRGSESERQEKRRTLLPVVAQALANPGVPTPPPRPRDPMLVAMPSGKGKTAVVFEANALRNSPVGELLLDCLRARAGHEDPFEQLHRESGVDMLRDVDRVAITSDGALISGDFHAANFDKLFGNAASRTGYGDHGMIYTPPHRDEVEREGPKPSHQIGAMAVWNGQMVISAESVADAQRIIDRLEGRGPQAPPALNEGETYGEVYGTLAPADLAELLGPSQKALTDKLQDAAQEVKLHVDASRDVAVVADLGGDDKDKVTDLGKTLGGVLSLARLKAQADGDADLTELLDLARVRPEGGAFRAELALPLSMLEKQLSWCRERLDGGRSSNLAVPPAPPAAP
jgi:hypothetical protein